MRKVLDGALGVLSILQPIQLDVPWPRLARTAHSSGQWAGVYLHVGRLVAGVSQPVNGLGQPTGYVGHVLLRRGGPVPQLHRANVIDLSLEWRR